MKRIILILLFVCVGSLSFATSLDLTYEIPTNNDQYVINKYKMGYEERENVKVIVWVGGVVLLGIILVVLTVSLLNEPDTTTY